MKISVEAISSVKKSIQIEVPSEAVAHEFDHVLQHLQQDVRVPGFRPGKAPLALLTQKYEERLREEVLRKLIPQYCQKAIEEAGISPVDMPTIQKIDFKKGATENASLSFTALFDILPKVQLSNYTGLILPQKEITVTEADVEKGLAAIREQQGHLENLPEDHPIAASDYVTIDFGGEVEGRPLKGGKKEGYSVQVGSKTAWPEVEEALLGRKKGESVSVDILIPADNPEKEIAGKTVFFKIDVKEVKARKLPELDDELAKDLGIPSLLELREKLKTALLAERTARQKQDQKNRLIDKLIELHPVEAPEPMVERELRSMQRQSGAAPDPEGAGAVRGIARKRVKGSLILEAIAKEEKIEVSDSDLDDAIKRLSEGMGVPYEKGKRDMMQSPEALRGLKELTLEGKALDRVYALAQFEEVKEKT